jgi:hypothetical protein
MTVEAIRGYIDETLTTAASGAAGALLHAAQHLLGIPAAQASPFDSERRTLLYFLSNYATAKAGDDGDQGAVAMSPRGGAVPVRAPCWGLPVRSPAPWVVSSGARKPLPQQWIRPLRGLHLPPPPPTSGWPALRAVLVDSDLAVARVEDGAAGAERLTDREVAALCEYALEHPQFLAAGFAIRRLERTLFGFQGCRTSD